MDLGEFKNFLAYLLTVNISNEKDMPPLSTDKKPLIASKNLMLGGS